MLAKAEEEICELKAALSDDKSEARAAHKVAEEFGDLLFVMVNVARHLRIDPEAALRDANAKFVRRFRSIEAALRAEGRTPEAATLEEMDQLPGMRPRPRRPARRTSYSAAAMPSRAGPARRMSRWRFSGATPRRIWVSPSPRSERLITSQFS